MPTHIKCPNCGHEFEPNDRIREEIEKDLRAKAEEWKKKKETGKWKDAHGYAATNTGDIALQSSHSNVESCGICFRNIKIKPL